MEGQVTVWGRRSAFNVQKVLWMLGELGLPHEHIEAGGAAGGLNSPDFLALNPNGRIPVLEDGDHVIWESHAILRYLAAKHGAGSLWPEDVAARSEADRWMDWSQSGLQGAFMDLFWGFYRTPEDDRDAAFIERASLRCDRLFELLDGHLETSLYLGGNSFTMADIPAGTTLYRYYEMDVARGILPYVEAWYERLKKREAFQTHIMVPFDDLKGRLDY